MAARSLKLKCDHQEAGIPLLNDPALEQSPIVANCRMNRERGCSGGNSYAKELYFNPLEFLRERLQTQPHVAWLDLCCGTGRALIDAAQTVAAESMVGRATILGVDLVDMFDRRPDNSNFLRLQVASLSNWQPPHEFDLITCVHGLHYIGDKLGLVQRACSWLTPRGLFAAHLDFSNLRMPGAPPARMKTEFVREFRRAGVEFNSRRHLLRCTGRKQIVWPFRYLGADDAAGPNYTGQPAVNSHYERVLRVGEPACAHSCQGTPETMS